MIYNKLASYYDQFVDHNLNDIYFKLIKKYFSSGIVLDLGCGTGPLAIKMAKAGFYVTASDISEKMLLVAYNNSITNNVKINFFIHNILEPLNIDSDVITMSSDVINYLDTKNEVVKTFKNVSEIMNSNSIYLFDFLKTTYLENLVNYHEEILLDDTTLVWDVLKTNETFKVKHVVTINNEIETHTQKTYKESEYVQMTKEAMLKVVEKVELEDRIIFVCKKDL